jgi:uncharacterized protein (TIGR02246 family)
MSPKTLEGAARARAAAAGRSEQSILELIETFVAGWNAHDMEVFSAPFAEDADFVNVAGAWWRGRREIADRHGERHRTRFKSSRIRAERTSIRFIRPDVAVVHLQWELAGDTGPDGRSTAVRHGLLTFLASEERGRWRFDAAQNTDIIVA